ncbi:MAG: hypothetical protein IH596_02175 [Bacteroidales bacterium]|nr:hypothetical protein [Bacteroidales bacterium]
MIEQRKRHFLIFLPIWIIPVFLITFGSLINFHQNKIWGKQLLPYSFVTPRDKTKIVKTQDVKNQITDFILFDSLDEIAVYQPEIQINRVVDSEETGFRFLMASGLRAPPLA